MVDALKSLQNIKQQMKTKEYRKADMWCHFGTANIRGPDEGTAYFSHPHNICMQTRDLSVLTRDN